MDGQKVGGRYTIVRLVNMGGMGAVYEAVDDRMGRTVALKLLLNQKPGEEFYAEMLSRLHDEARAAARLRSSRLVRVLDSGEDGYFGFFVVYEFLGDGSLRDELDRRGRLPEDELCTRLALPMLEGLSVLHDAGLVHRDVKPANLLQGQSGDYKVGDLGLVLFEGREAATATGVMIGTPGYMAPETIMCGSDCVSPAADCYSAAVVIFEAATGRLPFDAVETAALLNAQLSLDISVPYLVERGLSPGLAPVLKKAMQQDPGRRFPDAGRFLTALSNGGQSATIHSEGGRDRSTRRLSVKTTPKEAAGRGSAGAFTVGRSRYHLFAAFILLFILAALFLFVGFPGNRQSVEAPSAAAALPPPEICGIAHRCKADGPLPAPADFQLLLSMIDEASAVSAEEWRNLETTLPRGSYIRQLFRALRLKQDDADLFRSFRDKVLDGDKYLDPSVLGLETVFLGRMDDRKRTNWQTLRASRRFIFDAERILGRSSLSSAHRLYLMVLYAGSLARRGEKEKLEDMRDALSMLLTCPGLPEPTVSLIRKEMKTLSSFVTAGSRSMEEFVNEADQLHNKGYRGVNRSGGLELAVSLFKKKGNVLKAGSDDFKSIRFIRRAFWDYFLLSNLPETYFYWCRPALETYLDVLGLQGDDPSIAMRVRGEWWGRALSREECLLGVSEILALQAQRLARAPSAERMKNEYYLLTLGELAIRRLHNEDLPCRDVFRGVLSNLSQSTAAAYIKGRVVYCDDSVEEGLKQIIEVLDTLVAGRGIRKQVINGAPVPDKLGYRVRMIERVSDVLWPALRVNPAYDDLRFAQAHAVRVFLGNVRYRKFNGNPLFDMWGRAVIEEVDAVRAKRRAGGAAADAATAGTGDTPHGVAQEEELVKYLDEIDSHGMDEHYLWYVKKLRAGGRLPVN